MVLHAVVRKRSLVDIFLYLVRQQIFVGLVAAPCVDVGMMVFLYQPFQPVAVYATVVFLGDKVGYLLDVLVEVHPLLFRY